MNYLPIDYYILLQKGYKEEKPSKKKQRKRPQLLSARNTDTIAGSDIPRTNMIMFSNLPVLNKKSNFFQGKKEVARTLTFEDIWRSFRQTEKREAVKLLMDPYAENEFKKVLIDSFGGDIRKLEYINFDPNMIVDNLMQNG
mmetsp:Transcript_19360/g.29681  ORF Transcript_19360/g.29681 Transcript_19360/m.29681 type:complete len:141 (-) Transcript_19360:1098-1520(-)